MAASNSAKAPEFYQEDNLLGNVVGVIADRTDKTAEEVAQMVADEFGGDYSRAESVLWDDLIGPMIDRVQDMLGLEWQ